MPDAKSWVLTDARNRVWVDAFDLGPGDLGLPTTLPWSIRKQTLRGGLSEGVDLIAVNNGALCFSVLPTRGMGIWRGEYQGMALGWASPVQGPVHPQFVNLMDREGLGWLNGFDEMIVRCGLDSNGAPDVDRVANNMGVPAEVRLPLHGRIANLPASRVEVQVIPGKTPRLVILGVTEESVLFGPNFRLVSRVETLVGSNTFTIIDEVTNRRGVVAEMELLYHCNFGSPVLEEGSRFLMPARMAAPRDGRAAEGMAEYDTFQDPTPGFVEQCYWFEPLADGKGKTMAMLRNGEGDKAVVIRFNTHELPAFTLWKNTAARNDGYVTGLEPGTDYPNSKVVERKHGRLKKLPPGGTCRTALTLEVLNTVHAVDKAEKEVEALQKLEPCKVHKKPKN